MKGDKGSGGGGVVGRNVIILAAPATDAAALLERLSRHPEITAPNCPPLGRLLHGASNGMIRAYAGQRIPGKAGTAAPGVLDPVALARESCAAALAVAFAQMRRSAGRDVVVVWDPDGLPYPFATPPDVHVVLLYADPAAAAERITAGVLAREVSAEINGRIVELERRVAAWGLDASRLHRVEESDLARRPALARLLAFLGAASSPAAVDLLLAPAAGSGLAAAPV